MENVEKRMLLQSDMYEKVKKSYVNYKKSPKDRITVGYLQSHMESLDTYWKEFKTGHEELITTIPEDARQKYTYFSKDMSDSFEEIYFTYKGEMKTQLQKLIPEACKIEEKNVSESCKSGDLKLPPISIPTFGGDYTEWQSFHDLFMALVHKNAMLENVKKLHYLKSSLKGEAEVLLRQFSVTEDNYTEAWSILKRRYSNQRYIANCIFKKFFGQRVISNESAVSIKQLLDTSVECINALKNLGLPTDQWDAIVNYIVVSKLDSETHKQWEESISKDSSEDLPDFAKLKEFLETRFRTLEMVGPGNKINKPVKPKTFHTITASDIHCSFCKERHYIFNCKQFANQSIEDKYTFVQKNNLCFNCLVSNHSVYKCRQKSVCHICKRKHHSLLHRDLKQSGGEISQEKAQAKDVSKAHQQEEKVSGHVSTREDLHHGILLATAQVDVISSLGQTYVFRALIDQGSEASFVTARAVEVLGLKKTQISYVVSGVGDGNKICINHLVELIVKSRLKNNFTFNVNAYVLKSLTRRLPGKYISGYDWPQLKNMKLADPTFDIPGRIDILLGADVFSKIIDSGLIRGPADVIAQYTHLGWILSGDIKTNSTNNLQVTSLHIHRVVEDNNLLRKFWKIETELYTRKKIWNMEEEKCEQHYVDTTTRDSTGRYVVHLPLKQNVEETKKVCGETKHQAITRFKQLERKFEKNENLKTEYTKVIQEYLKMGYMKKVENENEETAIYLPHHAIVREDKDTTKVRVLLQQRDLTVFP